MSKKLEKLSPEQLILMQQVKEEWLARAFSGEVIDVDRAKAGIEWLYSFSKLKIPQIIFVESPLAIQYAVQYIKVFYEVIGKAQVSSQVWLQVRAQVGDQVRAQVGDQVRAQVWLQVWDQVSSQVWLQVWDQVSSQVGDQVSSQVGDQVRAQVWDQVRAQVSSQVGDQVRAQVGDQKLEWFTPAYYGNISDYGWIAFYDFFERIGLVKLSGFNDFKKLIQSNIYEMVQLENLCVVCALPSNVQRDQMNRLHSAIGPAIEWKDGFKLWFLHGVPFSQEEFEKFASGETRAIDIIKHENQDKKRAMALAYGNEKMIKELKAKRVKTDKDGNGNDMSIMVIKTQDEPMVYYEAIDPSKNEPIYLRLPPEFKNKKPMEAKCWTFKPMWEEYQKTGEIPKFIKET